MERQVWPEFDDEYWKLIDRHFEKKRNQAMETLFSVGNGYLGMRGTFEEGLSPYSTEGTFINGFYDSYPLSYPEKFYGYAETDQVMLNVANARVIRVVFEDGELYGALTRNSSILDYHRALDMQTGVHTRELTWRSASGKVLRLKSERLVSFRRPHMAAVRLTLIPEQNCGQEITITSLIDCNVQRPASQPYDPRSAAGLENLKMVIEGQEISSGGAFLFQRTYNTQLVVACGLQDVVRNQPDVVGMTVNESGLSIGNSYTVPFDSAVVFEKYIAYCTSLDTRPDDLHDTVRDELEQASAIGFDGLCAEQRDYLQKFWQRADIHIGGDEQLKGSIRFNLFHLLQSAGQNGYTSIPAKGLTGQTYNGHYFWDTEAYMVPFFLHTMPDIARKLLEYRFNTLPRARRRARQMSHRKGALFAWRTINGDECSANPPTGTAQYHINADIAFAVKRYYEATGDTEFMLRYGVELLCETARMWNDLGHWCNDQFCIFGVTGPDEYTTQVNNNTYTNLMARENMQYAVDRAEWMQEHYPEDWQTLQRKIGLEDGELADWQHAADEMYVPQPQSIGKAKDIMPQDDSFLYKPRWDEFIQKNKVERKTDDPLLLLYHPLVYNRYQVCKQADLILAEFMVGHLFSAAQKKRDFDYYKGVTTHDSSLSRSIFSIMAAELTNPNDPEDAYLKEALELYEEAATIDLRNHRNETPNGIHAANMGGSWMGIVFGFARMRTHGQQLAFSPVLPPGWTDYRFQVYYQGRRVQVQVGPGREESGQPYVDLRLIEGEGIDVKLYGNDVHLSAGRD